jgi:hypothetical protein
VFSTNLWAGDGSSETITNGIDFSGEGGMVWFARRTTTDLHTIIDTERGGNTALFSTSTSANYTNAQMITSFNSNGFNVGSYAGVNDNNEDLVGWSFRKQAGFFDVVTYTGDGTSSRDIAHNLGSKPGFILTKRLNLTGNWTGYHQSLGYTKRIYLDLTNAASTNAATWVQEPTATHFTVGSENTSGSTYVAYLFAHDDQSFGDNGDESIIKCGSYTSTGNSVTGIDIDLGWEPQWILQKNSSSASTPYWMIADTMRGLIVKDGTSYPAVQVLKPNATDTEADPGILSINNTGFTSHGGFNNGDKIIYIAIRRPMKTPESGTEVFKPYTRSGGTTGINSSAGHTVDLLISKDYNSTFNWWLSDRMRGSAFLKPNGTDSEFTSAPIAFDAQTGINLLTDNAYHFNESGDDMIDYTFKRATGFFDVVAYTGTGVAGHTLNHNLGVAPELIIIKDRDAVTGWYVGVNFEVSAFNQLQLQSTSSASSRAYSHGIDAKPTANLFSVGVNTFTNDSGDSYIAYLFATLAGVSKVGSYTGTGADLNVDCGFSAGARFVMIKRTDSTGDWYVWDTERGIVAGNDPYLLLNTTAAEVTSTDYIDPLSSGFTVTSSAPAALNASGGEYIFLAIA